MADELYRGAGAELHAVNAVQSLRADLLAVGAHPALRACAVAVVLAAPAPVLALAQLGAARPVEPVGARDAAARACPAGRALALACDVVALCAVLARALELAVRSIVAVGARVLARQPYVARAADVVSSYVVARFVAEHDFWAFLLAAQAVRAARAGLRAVGSRPALVANARTGLRVAGRVVVAAALLRAVVAVEPSRALRFAIHSCKQSEGVNAISPFGRSRVD